MKTIFIPARYEIKSDNILPKIIINQLPKSLVLASTIQYLEILSKVKKELEEQGKKVELAKGHHSKNKGQVLGCDKIKTKNFLYVGDGFFHPKMALVSKSENVFCFNPKTNELTKLTTKDIEKIDKKVKAGLSKYYMSDNIGILVTTKWGQEKLKKALILKNKLERKGKNAYVLMADTMNFDSLEDFNFIDCYVNTMCPRIGYDDSIRLNKPIINYELLEE